MIDLLDEAIRPPAKALTAEPLSLAEIDAHPDSARIWATVLSIREAYNKGYDEGFQDGFQDGLREARERE